MTNVGGYRYVGPDEIADRAAAPDAIAVSSPAALAAWLAGREHDEVHEPFTFVVALDGGLRLASRRSEHVILADHGRVLAAGEMRFDRADGGWRVVEVTNQSTGYCPGPDSWPAVGAALDNLGVSHPGEFTEKITFRRCPACGERNIVRDNDFTCALCDNALPT